MLVHVALRVLWIDRTAWLVNELLRAYTNQIKSGQGNILNDLEIMFESDYKVTTQDVKRDIDYHDPSIVEHTWEEVKAEFQNFRIGAEFDGILYNEADIKFFKDIVDSAVKNQSQIDQMTDKALAKNWPIDRIDPTIRALFRSGTAELFLGKTPVAVIINEFVDIAKAFFPEGKEAKFVNAVLDQISKDMLKEGS